MNKRLFAIAFFIVLAFGLYAQEPTLVSISSSGEAIEGVELFLTKSKSTYSSNKTGKIELENIEAPEVALFFKPGYAYLSDTIFPKQENRIELEALSEQLREVVVSDFQGTAKLSESVLNVRKVSIEQIEAQSAQNIEQALAHQGLLRSNRDNALNMNSLKIMGLGGENLKVLVDGVPMIGRMLGNLDLSEISSNSIEGIEIIEGPMSVIYGSNALAGAINIVTKTNYSKKQTLKFDSYNTENGTHNVGAAYDRGFGKNAVSLSGGRNFFQGWNATDRARGWTWLPKEQYYGNLKLSRQTKNLTLNASSRYSQSYLLDRGEPIMPYGEQAIDREYRRKRADQLFSAVWNPTTKFSTRVLLHQNFFEQIKNTYSKDLVTLEQQLSPQVAEQDTQRFTAEGMKLITNYKLSNKTKFLAGFDANQERLKGPRIKDFEQENSELALYGSYEQRIKTMDLRLGIRKGYVNQSFTPWVFALQGRVPLSDNLILRASYGRAYRIASVKESYLDFVDSNHKVYGNSNLQPEDGNSYQVKLTQLLSIGAVQNSFDLGLFYNDISNKIELVNSSPLEASYQNIGSFKSQGINFVYHMQSKSLDFKAEFNSIGINYGNGLDYSNRATGQLMFKFPKWKSNLSVFGSAFLKQYVSVFAAETGEIERFAQDPYGMLDLQAGKKFFKERVSLTLGMRNILNVTQILQNSNGGIHQSGAGSAFISNGRSLFINASWNVFK